jgi:hypothetical protein
MLTKWSCGSTAHQKLGKTFKEYSSLCQEREAHNHTKRERDEAQRELEMWKFERDEALEHAARYRLEANKLIMMGVELREQNAKLRDIAEKAIKAISSSEYGEFSYTSAVLRAELDQIKEDGK